MSEFVFLFRTSPEEERAVMGTPEQAQRALQVWLEWIRGLEAGGHLKSPGQPLATTGSVVRGNGGTLVTDGPFVEAKDIVLGFLVIEARDLAQAIELSRGCPMLAGNGSVEVRPVAAPMW